MIMGQPVMAQAQPVQQPQMQMMQVQVRHHRRPRARTSRQTARHDVYTRLTRTSACVHPARRVLLYTSTSAPQHQHADTLVRAFYPRQVPAGTMGGQMLQVQTPAGMMQVQIPQGLQAGQVFQMQVPMKPPQPVMQMAQPVMQQQPQVVYQQQPQVQYVMQQQPQQIHHHHRPVGGHVQSDGIGMGLAGGLVGGLMLGAMMDGGDEGWGGDDGCWGGDDGGWD